MFGFLKFFKGIKIVPKTSSEVSEAGDIDFNTTDGKLSVHDGSTASNLVSETHAAQGSHRLKNKDLEDSSTAVVDSSDTTKKIKFDAAGSSGTSTTILGSQTADRTLTLPDNTGSLISTGDTGTITSTMILDGTIVNGDINASAGIVDTKLATISTSGKVSNSATTGTASATASTLVLRDSSANTAVNKLNVGTGSGNGLDVPSAGALEIGATVGANNITVGGSSSTVVIPGNVQVNGTTTNVNTTNMVVTDKNITVNNGGNDASSEGAGLTIDRTGTDGSFIYKDTSATKFAAGAAGSEIDLVGVSGTQTLTGKTLTSATLTTPSTDIVTWDDQSSTPSNPSSGFYKTYFKTDGKLYKLDSAGLEKEIGSGVGGINYIQKTSPGNYDFEASVSGWNTYADAAGSSPVDGTGGSPSLTFTRTTSSPLRDTGSGLVTKDAANRQGNGVSYDFTIDSADQAKVLQVTADYAIASGTYADGDLTVYIYDVTNALVIQPAGYVINNLATGLPGKINATFQTASNSTSYRLIIHCASTSAVAYTVKLDNVSVGPQIVEYGAPITNSKDDSSNFTPAAGFGTITNKAIFTRRDGDRLIGQGYFTAGTTAATEASISLVGYSIDTTKIPSTSKVMKIGEWRRITSGGAATNDFAAGANGHIYVTAATPNKLFLVWQAVTSAYTDPSVSTIINTGDGVNFQFDIPISGWSSSVVMSNDTDTRVVSFRATKTANQSVTANTTNITFETVVKDSHNAFSGQTTYTVPVPGDYWVGFSGAASVPCNVYAYVNGTVNTSVCPILSNGYGGTSGALLPNLKAGDLITFRNSVTTTQLGGANPEFYFIDIFRLSGPAVVAASEKIYLQYYTNGGTSLTGSVTNIDFTTKVVDSHGAWSGAVFTAPRAGMYLVSGTVRISSADAYIPSIYVNGVQKFTIGDNASESYKSLGGGIYLNSGDQLSLRHGTNATLVADSNSHWILITSQG